MKRNTTTEDLLRLLEPILANLSRRDPQVKTVEAEVRKVADRDNARFELDRACRQFLDGDRQ